jgi:hypothetical protein
MRHLVVTGGVAIVVLLAVSSTVWAHCCPDLVNRIYALAGTRVDRAAHEAKAKAALAARLHADGRHEAGEGVARQGLALLGEVGSPCKPADGPRGSQ